MRKTLPALLLAGVLLAVAAVGELAASPGEWRFHNDDLAGPGVYANARVGGVVVAQLHADCDEQVGMFTEGIIESFDLEGLNVTEWRIAFDDIRPEPSLWAVRDAESEVRNYRHRTGALFFRGNEDAFRQLGESTDGLPDEERKALAQEAVEQANAWFVKNLMSRREVTVEVTIQGAPDVRAVFELAGFLSAYDSACGLR